MTSDPSNPAGRPPPPYILDEQVGFILRQVNQRHTTIFASRIGEDLTPTQWAALSKLREVGPQSQNLLGRLTAMDAATIKGVVDRLTKRGLTEGQPDPEDGRRLVIALTAEGEATVQRCLSRAAAITEETLEGLTAEERKTLLALLKKMR
jgi:MarR family transcriptional regulator, lower aerobic nicotinate degradation pathway regulator